MPKFSQDALGISNNYCEWLRQHEPCYNKYLANPFGFSKSFKGSIECLKSLGHYFKYLGEYCQQEFLKIWSVKSTVYSLESNLINYSIFNLYFTNNSWSHSSRHCAKCIPIGYISYLNFNLVVNICKRKNEK